MRYAKRCYFNVRSKRLSWQYLSGLDGWGRAAGRTRLCLHNNTDVAYYNFDARRPISTIFGTVVAETVCYQAIILFSTSPD